MTTNDDAPSRATLDRAPARTLAFLIGAGRNPAIRGMLETRGYTQAEHERGWRLLRAVDPAGAAGAPGDGATVQSDPAVREALAKLDAWDNENLPIADVALRRREPAAHRYLFAGALAPADGAASVQVVQTFLDRVDALTSLAEPSEKTAARGKKSADPQTAKGPVDVSAAQARSALEILTSRGVTDAVRATARGWLHTAQRGAAPATPAQPRVVATDVSAAQVELHDWISEWALVARKVLKRRDHLIAVGLAEKKPPRRAPRVPAAPAAPR